ncbi:GNAT family N-acetyltransferase [Amycolatopsis samaneae]
MHTPLIASGPELTAAQLHDILRLRCDVFVVEQKAAYLDVDGLDLLPGTSHLWFESEDGVESYLRVLSEPDDVQRIGRVCTAGKARGRGLAARLMEAALVEHGDTDYVLDAQTYVQEFYARFGFTPHGEEFVDDDGIPHITMWRRAEPSR